MKKIITITALLLLNGCANYFSNYRTVYRIEATNGQRYYSENEPNFDKKSSTYHIEDLDGNKYEFEKGRIYQIEKFRHKK